MCYLAYLVKYAIWRVSFCMFTMQFGTKKSLKTRIFIILHLAPHRKKFKKREQLSSASPSYIADYRQTVQ